MHFHPFPGPGKHFVFPRFSPISPLVRGPCNSRFNLEYNDLMDLIERKAKMDIRTFFVKVTVELMVDDSQHTDAIQQSIFFPFFLFQSSL